MHGGQGAVRVAALSDTGHRRTANQDFAYAGPLPLAPGWTLIAVADGVGGQAHGDWASQRALSVFAAALDPDTAEPLSALASASREAAAAVARESRMGKAGAATTLVAVVIHGNEAWTLNIGDSRAYLASGGRIRQLTADHSWVAEEVACGRLSPTDAEAHANRNVITRAIGADPLVEADVQGPITLSAGATVLVCSDGLHGPVADADIASALEEDDIERAARSLVQRANEAGGPDNVTVGLARIAGAAEPVAITVVPENDGGEPARPRRKRLPRRLTFVLAGLLSLAAGGTGIAVALRLL